MIEITEEEANVRLAEVYAARGYLVLARGARREPYKLGMTATDVKLFYADKKGVPQPFRVVALTTLDDFVEQSVIVGGDREETVSDYCDGYVFYRVESD